VRFIIPFAPGGGSDIVGRVICAKLQEAFGQPFVPDNRAGGNSVIGLNACAKAPPDGYVLSLLTGAAGFGMVDAIILWELRLPRTVLAALIGGGLGLMALASLGHAP
jgi:ABC-type Fe3+-siderophore transport system permease subunit